ncbi:GLPGLI family protein [Chryseobacterium sp. C-71]|uniref:GLPGLI family protein n=1 Tax=Chryseobacterium sp. C-71 TaxID=2893882 RepID=UPI001E45D8C7|nr:GLPGLI family protein [Chryseobacterium sp. C-71]UFH31428.1 GLPGLI family protein [Chryseobacterium sp. C-71]
MKIKTVLILLILMVNYLKSQDYHVKYVNNVSSIATVDEDLYISKNKIISVRDSVINFNTVNNSNAAYNQNNNSIQISSRSVPYKVIYLKNIDNKKIEYSEYLGGKKYLIEDNLPLFDWKINFKSIKQIANYTCYEAKMNYRGSKIIAFFTKEIPISTGPFKFGGLPGLILEISEEGKNYNSWKANVVEKLKGNIDIKNDNSNHVNMREFLILEEKENEKSFLKKTSSLAKDVVIKRMKVPRQGIEKKYEWENE